MTFGRALPVTLATFALIAGMLFFVSTNFAFAEVPNPNVEIDVNPPSPDSPGTPDTSGADGSEINCDIYQENGQPIPDFCDDAGGGGGGGETPACGDGLDNDGDSLVDSADPGCANSADNDETNTPGGGGGDPGGGGGDPGGGSPPTGGGGNSGGPATACEDSVDNDADGLIDMNDPGCANPADQDESNATSGGGGGGGGGAAAAASSTGEVLGVAETPVEAPSCDTYLTAFIKSGQNNDVEQVKRLQRVLIDSENAEIEENGVYDAGTVAAVHALQTKYASEILTPWNIENSTGFVFLTTRKKVNEIYCKSLKQFPLSSDELQKMASIMSKGTYMDVSTFPSAPQAAPKQMEKTAPTSAQPAAAAQADENEEPVTGSSMQRIWRPISDFFGRFFR